MASLTVHQQASCTMNPSNYRAPPPSFKTNVNRAKTKRWVEAKSYSYDGDDWGEADEYDEYDDYGPEPAQHPGMRQAGHPGTPPDPARQNVPQPRMQGAGGPARTNSFDPDDEQRAFSGPHAQPLPTAYAQYQQPQSGSALPRQQHGPHPSQGHSPQGHPPYSQPPQQHRRPSGDSQGRPIPPGPGNYPGHPPRSGPGSRTHSMTSNTSGADPYRRDFSNASAMPSALQPSRPPRKSSLSQQEGLGVTEGPDQLVSPISDASDGAFQAAGQRDRSASGSTHAFVRPADIYRRMHEEKERERLSQDSSRPSLDAINKSRDESPAISGGEEGRTKKSALEPVTERRSEYGMEGFLSKGSVEPKPPSRGPNGSPMLPDLKGLGQGFGDDFGMSFVDSKQAPSASSAKAPVPKVAEPQSTKSEAVATPTRTDTTSTTATLSAPDDASLQHRPSRGFRSAVDTAFDQPIRQPSSASESIGRSNSDSTNAISPIITRPQSAHNARNEVEHPPTIQEEPSTSSTRPTSGNTITAPRPFGEDARRGSSSSIPGFVPGHRRDMNTPSPDNSPARTPVLEANKQLRNPQEVEFDLTTPASTELGRDSTDDESPPAAAPKPLHSSHDLPQLVTPTKAQVGMATGASTPQSRAESPTKGRVRDLTDKFEGASSHDSNSPVKDTLKPREESPARNHSFRPDMPGGWVSYAPSVTSQQVPEATPRTGSAASRAAPDATSRTGSAASKTAPDPFATAAAAGSALASSIATAVGMGQSSDSESSAGPRSQPQAEKRRSKVDTAFNPEAQRLMAPVEEDDNASSVVPTPADMKHESEGSDPEYFAPVAPLKQKAVRSTSGKQLPSLSHISPVEALSVDNSPNDQESDRLRKELVRELSPQAESFRKDGPGAPHAPTSSPPDPRFSTVTHDSSVLPAEYDSYWNGSPHATGTSPQFSQHPPGGMGTISPKISPPQAQGAFKSVESPATAYADPSHGTDSAKPGMLQQRFSWETPLQDPNEFKPVSPPGVAKVPATRDRGVVDPQNAITMPPAELHAESSAAELDGGREGPDIDTNKELPKDPRTPNQQGPHAGTSHPTESRTSLSLAPSEITQAQEPLREPSGHGVLLGGPLPPAPFETQPKAPTFKEIIAMRSPVERIENFNVVRERIANEETGLSQWITYMTENVQEHADIVKAGGVSHHPSVPTKTPLASAASTPFGTPGPATGPSPASGKPKPAVNTSKAKEIFSSGGMVAGKSKAKELFSKGRSRFRKSGSEKVDH